MIIVIVLRVYTFNDIIFQLKYLSNRINPNEAEMDVKLELWRQFQLRFMPISFEFYKFLRKTHRDSMIAESRKSCLDKKFSDFLLRLISTKEFRCFIRLAFRFPNYQAITFYLFSAFSCFDNSCAQRLNCWLISSRNFRSCDKIML